MIVKLMDDEPGFDDSPSKGCRIVSEVLEARYRFNEPTNEAMLDVTYRIPNRGLEQETFVLSANAYLMNDSGKTIQSFAARR